MTGPSCGDFEQVDGDEVYVGPANPYTRPWFALCEVRTDVGKWRMLVFNRDHERLSRLAAVQNATEDPSSRVIYRVVDYATARERVLAS